MSASSAQGPRVGSLDSHVPDGPIEDKWTNHKFDMKLVAPHNRRRFEVIVVGTGLAGAAAAATLGELGYGVKAFTFHDSQIRKMVRTTKIAVIIEASVPTISVTANPRTGPVPNS